MNFAKSLKNLLFSEAGKRVDNQPLSDLQGVDEAPYLQPGKFINSDAPAIHAFAERHTKGISDKTEQAVALYYAVRDGIRYDPYICGRAEDCFLATRPLQDKAGFCIPKSALLAAAARAVGIPAAVGYADVKNHLTTEKLRAKMGTDLFVFHGFTSLKLNGKWVKATPAFNLELCQKFGTIPLEFDGTEDSLLQGYDVNNNRHMEYLKDRGIYWDVPFEEIIRTFDEVYGGPLVREDAGEVRFEDEKPIAP